MASTINKYDKNIAPARYQTKGGTSSVPVSGRTGATVDPFLLSGKPAAGKPAAGGSGSGGLASRLIEAPIQTRSPEDQSITDGEASIQPQMITETQQPIESRGSSARYMIQGGGPKIDLSFLVPARANKAFDPSKAIGGKNVPFQESKGVGGFLRRFLGDDSNAQNIAAQQAQGAKWEQAAHEQLVEDRATARIAAADKTVQTRFDAGQTAAERRETTRAAEAASAFEEAKKGNASAEEGRKLDRERQARRDTITDQNTAQTRTDLLTQQLIANKLDADKFGVTSNLAVQPHVNSLPDGRLAVTDPKSGKISIITPGTPGFKNTPGTPSTTKEVYPQVAAPLNNGGPDVDPKTGLPLGGKLPPPNTTPLGPENQNTALGPRFMQGAGEVISEGAHAATDPLRMIGTELNKLLFNSNTQQDPEVLKRLEERTRRNALTPPRSALPLGY